ncbi:MAG: EAL domain-containing protein [Gammaproteobacteria bacterium]|nr:EAL domain-containing protein [Gammaproteobacteria bacterium]
MILNIYRLILTALCCSFLGQAIAADIPPREDSKALYFRQLSIEQGLKSRWVSALAQDKRGFVWIGSSNGLQRYDGYQFLDVSGHNQILLGSEVYDIFIDSKQRLWVANEKSAFEVNTTTLKTRAVAFEGDQFSDTVSTPVLKIKESADGSIWFTRWDGLFRIAPNHSIAHKVTEGFTDLDFSEDGLLSMELVDQQLLIGTSKGLYITDLENRFLRRIIYTQDSDRRLNESRIRNILTTRKHIWIATDKGLFQLARQQLNQSNNLSSKLILNIEINNLSQSSDYIWVATIDGVFRINKATETIEPFITQNEKNLTTNNNSFEEVLMDEDGYLWLATSGRGIYQWSPITQSISSALVSSSILSRFGQAGNIWTIRNIGDFIWVGTENGLFKLDQALNVLQEYQVTPSDWHFSERAVFNIIDNGDKFWLTTFYDIREFDPKTGKVTSIEQTHPKLFQTLGIEFSLLRQFSNGLLWVGFANGLKVYSLEQRDFLIENFTTADGKPFVETIAFMKEDRLGDKWIATSSGLYRANVSEGTLTKVFSQSFKVGDPYVSASAVYRKNENELWVAYAGAGLFQLQLDNNGRVLTTRHFNAQQGLHDLTLYSLYFEHGYFWISTHDGIILFNPQAQTFTRLAAFDGVYEHEFNQFAHTRLKDQTLAFGSINGLYVIDTENVIAKLPKPRPVTISRIERLSPDSKVTRPFDSYEQISVTAEDIGVRIFVTDFNFFNQSQSLFNFQLQGEKNFELKSGSENSVILAGLPAGQYYLTVSSTTGDVDSSLQVPISWLPPWWQSKVAISAYLVILVLTVLLLLKALASKRKAQQVKAEQLHLQAHLYNTSLQVSKQGIWQYIIDENIISFSKPGSTIPSQQMKFSEWLTLLNDGESKSFNQQFSAFLNNHENKFSILSKVKLNQHKQRWLQVDAVKSIGLNGQLSVIGCYLDMTDEVFKSANLAAYIELYQHSLNLQFQTNDDFIIESINGAFETVTQYNKEQAIGESIDLLYSAKVPVDYFQQIKEKLLTHSMVIDDSFIRCKNDRDIPVTVQAIRCEQQGKTTILFNLVDLSRFRELEHSFNKVVHYDPLTHLPNRSLLLDRLEHAIDRASHLKSQVAVLIINLDHFKSINDSLGHKYGDELLIEVAARIQHCINKDDTLARIGGDEFAIVLEDSEQIDRLSYLCQRVTEIMKQPFKLYSESVSISPSIGISLFPNDGRDNERLLKSADMAMHHAKSLGRGNFQFFTQSLNDIAKAQLTMEQDLHKAISNQEFYPVFQPRFDRNRQIVGFEVLLRWRTSSGKHISPEEFIPVAEKLNLILPITEWLFSYVCNLFKEYEALISQYEFSFNLSANHFGNYDLVKQIKSQLVKCDIPYSNIELEVNENTLMRDPDRTLEVISQLKSFGIRIAVDDFGTGSSSLSHLKRFDVDRIVIDRSFVWGINDDEHSQTIVNSMIQLGTALELEILAEGIESEEQLAFLKQRNCNFYQGYILSKPLSESHLISLLKQQN